MAGETQQACRRNLVKQSKRDDIISHDRAMQILRGIVGVRGLTLARVVGPCRRVETSRARKEFCIRAVNNGIPTRTIVDILSCDPSTVSYHVSPVAKARKNEKTRMRLATDKHIVAWNKLLRAQEMIEGV